MRFFLKKKFQKFVLTRRLSEMPGGIKSKNVSHILYYDPLEVAQQLSLMEHENFEVLKVNHYYNSIPLLIELINVAIRVLPASMGKGKCR